MTPVVYMNKIEQLKYILSFIDGKIWHCRGMTEINGALRTYGNLGIDH